MAEPADQVPRQTEFRKRYPDVTFEDRKGRLLEEASGEIGGLSFHFRTATLEQLLDAIEALAEKAAAKALGRQAGGQP